MYQIILYKKFCFVLPNFDRVHIVRLIFLLFPLQLMAQSDSSLLLQCSSNELALTFGEKELINQKLEGKQVATIELIANIGNHTDVSANRVVLEKCIGQLREFLFLKQIPENKITIKRNLVSVDTLYNTILINITYVPPKTGRVIYKTATVEILDTTAKKTSVPSALQSSKIEKRKAKKQRKTISKNEEPELSAYGKLNIEDFKEGNKVIIPDLLFVATRHQLRPVSYRSLYHLLQIMRDKPTMIIELQGHICCKSDGEDGMDFDTNLPNLSEARAKEVFDYLVRNGISPYRMTYRGFGSKYKRVEDNGNAIEGLLNRRVEVYIIRE